MLSALQFPIFLVSLIEDFLLIHFNVKIEIKKENTQMEFKYLLFCSSIDLFDVKDVYITDKIWQMGRERFLDGENLTSSSTKTT